MKALVMRLVLVAVHQKGHPICISCSNVRCQKHSNTREKLTESVQLRERAIQKGDEKLLALTSRDIVDAEAHYHVSCYKNYTNGNEYNVENETDGFELYHMIGREDPMDTKKLKTFVNMCKKKVVKSSGKEIILKADRSLSVRIIVMAQELSLQMEDLSTPDGLLRKTNKATLATTLQTNVTVADQLPENSASVVDGMNLVQRVKGGQATFGDIVTTILSMALSEGSQSNRIDIVFDTYRGNSIKNSERSAQGADWAPVAGYHRHTDREEVEEFPNKSQ